MKNAKARKTAKKPLDKREYPMARDARGSASREEIRRTTALINAPRQPNRSGKRVQR